MGKEKILVVDDEENLLELVKYNLEKEGYIVESVLSGEEAINAARTQNPDLIILDLMLPGIDGFDVCKILKNNRETSEIPIIILTAKGEDSDIVAGLEIGADDYVTKPFSPKVLIARIRTIFRRDKKNIEDSNDIIKINNLTINPARFEVIVKGKQIELTATEFAILNFLAQRPGWVFTRNQIITAVKGGDYPVTDRSIDVQIVSLRKKLESEGKYIETVRGIGYKYKI